MIVAFIAGTDDTGAFYKQFLRAHYLKAIWRLLPSLRRPGTWKRMWETIRYGGGEGSVAAELLSMAVAPNAQRSGLGSRLVDTLLDQMKVRGVDQVKVVAGEGNRAAISLYSRCGFEFSRRLEVHQGVVSVEMIWNS
jgi:GNAT superfamily N-acetyltransferase